MGDVFDLKKLLRDVFSPQPGEIALILVDLPHGTIQDNPDWADRRVMAEEWRQGFEAIGTRTLPLFTFNATGASNSDLPADGLLGSTPTKVADALSRANIAVAMTQFSSTAPLAGFTHRMPQLRGASMPTVLRRMTKTALAADYSIIARKTHILADLLTDAIEARVVFETGDEVLFDLRYRDGRADDGMCRQGKTGTRVINLPSGEAYIVPYEGERPREPSRTAGIIPLDHKGERMKLHIRENRIAEIEGSGPQADKVKALLDQDPARRNVAELGLGCNDSAVVMGNVLEDEKAGMHWAYGRSEHLGGTVSPSSFTSPAHVLHYDVVYARGCPIGVKTITLRYPDGEDEVIMRDNEYVIF